MSLTLSVIRYQNAEPPRSMRFSVDAGPCRIGRNPDNDLVLPDPERWVSGNHAAISYRDGGYYLQDRSSNGTYLNHSPERVRAGQEVELNDGDELAIGAYEVLVEIAEEAVAPATDLFDPFDRQKPEPEHLEGLVEGHEAPDVLDLVGPGRDDAFAPALGVEHPGPVSPKPPPPGDDSPPADDPFASYDPLADRDGQVLEFDELPRNRIDAAGAAASHADHTPQEHAYFRPSEAIPEGFDLLAGTPFAQEEPELEPEKEPELEPDRPVSPAPPAPTSEPEPAPREAPEPTLDRHPEAAEAVEVDEPKPVASTGAVRAATSFQSDLLEAFLSGLGSAGAAPAPGEELEYMRTCGALLRALTEGLMAVMRARTSFKSELRIEMTTIRSVENNPFKFSVSADDALAKLLLRNTRGYLPPVDAANEALDDVQAHEMAMIAGLRAALRALLARFDPNELEQRFKGESVLDNLLPVAKKGKCWDRFTEVYSEVAADTADDFLHLFGGAFIRAYENQVALLKEGRRRGGT